MIYPRLSWAESTGPSPDRKRRAMALARKILIARIDQEFLSEEYGLNREFIRRANAWARNPLAFHRISSLEWEEIKTLRLRTQSFSGHSLLHIGDAAGSFAWAEIPDDLDERHSKIDPSGVIAAWKALLDDVPEWARVRPPHMLGEMGWLVDNTLVNEDTRSYQERMSLLYRSGVLDWLRQQKAPRILEIGAGYGALALALRRAVQECAYVICDLPEALLYSGLYLTLAGEQNVAMYDLAAVSGEVGLLPHYLFERFRDSGAHFDLVINTLSLSEMSDVQVKTYADGIRQLIGDRGVFFEQNQDNRPVGMLDAASILAGFFSAREQIGLETPILHGRPHLWANNAAALQAIRPNQ